MTKSDSYSESKRLSNELGGLSLVGNWIGTDEQFWINQVANLRIKVNNQRRREALFRQILQAPVRRRRREVFRQVIQEPARRRQKARTRLIQADLTSAIQRRATKKMFDNLLRRNEFQTILNTIITTGKTLTDSQANTFWNNLRGKGKHTLKVMANGVETIVMMNQSSRDFVESILTNGLLVQPEGERFGSDLLATINLETITRLTLTKLTRPTRVIPNRDGSFFPYINTTDLNLLRYQIFTQEDAYDKKLTANREQCLIHTLLKAGVKESIVNQVKMAYISGLSIKKKDIKKVSTIIKSDITVHSLNKDGKIKKQLYVPVLEDNEEKNDPIDIAIYENHYLVFEVTKYTKFCIVNYDTVKDEDNFPNIVKRKMVNGKAKFDRISSRVKTRRINSLLLVHKFYQKGYFKKLDLSRFAEASSRQDLRDLIYLDNIQDEQRECGTKKFKTKTPINPEEEREDETKVKTDVYYADCESFVNIPNDLENTLENHELALLGVANSDNDNVDIFDVCDEAYHNAITSPEQEALYALFNRITNEGKKPALVYFHNLKYDYHLLEQYLNVTDTCEKDGQVYSISCIYKKQKIELRDSYKLLPFKLSKFQKEFKLSAKICKKEAISYTYYTKDNNNQEINIYDYCKRLSKKEQAIFNKVITKEPSYNISTQTFNPLSYYKEYLRLDCLVLKKGLEKFETLIKEITENKMSIYECLTISSLTDKYMTIEGAYKGVYEVQGNLRAYIAKAVYGGRVCCNKKWKKQVIKGKIADYDGVSLYPSAIFRLCRTMGLPMGPAKRFTNFTNRKVWKYDGVQFDYEKGEADIRKHAEHSKSVYDNCYPGYEKYFINKVMCEGKRIYPEGTHINNWTKEPFYGEVSLDLDNAKQVEEFKQSKKSLGDMFNRMRRSIDRADEYDISKWRQVRIQEDWQDKVYSILTVRITKVNKEQQMPFIAHKSDSSIHYLNTPPPKPIVIDSITLEDYIKFHEIEYEIIEGVYWDEGTNKKMGEVIQRLFNARLKAKKEGKKALSNTIKLMLNSSYGKTIMKKTNTETKVIKSGKDKFENYVYSNFNTIKNYRKLNKHNYKVEKICYDNSYNRGHIGCAILSTSKRIMNEVFDIANTNDYVIYYTDTDSLHCNFKDVPKLEEKYKEKYNRQLNGKQLEQFHTDFDMLDEDGNDRTKDKDGKSNEIYATKSIFLGKKSYIDILESKDKDGNTIVGHHIRCKGITPEGLEHSAKEYSKMTKYNYEEIAQGYWELYEDLSKGTKKKFILNPYNPDENKQKVLFEFKEGRVSTRKEFIRAVQF